MASEVLQILNLSPIPELSELELSTVLEQLSGFSDHNGDITDRNVEDILREAKELIDTSMSVKTESVDSNISLKYVQNSKRQNDSEVDKISDNHCDKQITEAEDIIETSKELKTDILNLSLSSDGNSIGNGKSDCTISNKNEMDSSEIEITPQQTPKSLTNHIQSTLVSLRECSQKIENKNKNSPQKTEEQPCKEQANNNQQSFSCSEKKSETLKAQRNNAENKKIPDKNVTKKEVVTATRKSGLKENFERNVNFKKGLRSLTLNESLKTLNCFERLYRGKPTLGDTKSSTTSERISNKKKASSLTVSKTMNHSKLESIHNVQRSKENESILHGKKAKTYVYKEFDGKYNHPGENIIDDDISFEKCLKLLNEESESSPNVIELTSFNCNEFAEKMLKECTASMNALQGEVEAIKSQMKKNEGNKNPGGASKTNFNQQICSQEDLVQVLKEENSKIFREIEDIKEQLKVNVETSRGNRAPEKVEVVEKLRSEVENLRRSLITAYSENNGISRLEEQFSLLKKKYDLQIGKLEYENKQLKDILDSGGTISFKDCDRTEAGIQTETDNGRNGQLDKGFGEVEWKSQKMVRSASLENCRRTSNAHPFITNSCENVDAATSPIRSSILPENKELCSVSVQCMGEWEEDGETNKKGASRQFQRLENKENVMSNKRESGKNRLNSVNQALNALKQRKLSEHENQLMITIRALHSEITVKDRDNKKLRNELEAARNQIKRLTTGLTKHKNDITKKYCHVGTQTIGLNPKIHEAYDPVTFQVSRELEAENEELRSRVVELGKVVDLVKEKRIRDLQVLQKLHEEEIDKLASRLNTQTALTNHLHSLLTNR